MIISINFYQLMQAAKTKERNVSSIHGRNFHGQIELTGNTLRLDITEFKKGGIFTAEVTNEQMEKEYRKFLIFSKTEDLFLQLIVNQNMEMTDENSLLMPIEVTFKQRNFGLKIQLPLQQRKFQNEGQKMQNLFEQIERINREKIKLQKEKTELKQQTITRLIRFKGDKTNTNYKSFEVSEDMKSIKFIGQNTHTNFTHESPLLNRGIYHFKVKIIKTAGKCIFLGACGRDVKNNINNGAYMSPIFIGLYLADGSLYGNNIYRQVTPAIAAVNGQSIFKIEIDMNRRLISWHLNNVPFYIAQLWKQMENVELYPVVNMYSNGDTLQFVNE